MVTVQDLTGYQPTWCSGCGNWSIGRAIINSLVEQKLDPSSLVVLFDIGCSGNMNDFVNAYAMHTLHGRSIANAVGVKLANHQLPVLVVAGDGAIYGEGGNHFLHACRGNHDITVLVHDNSVYGLTTGQVSPRAQKGHKSKSTPTGIIETPVYPLPLAITQGATFVAQAFAGNLPELSKLITAGMKHKGFSVINILQPCVTFNKINTFQYYLKHQYQLDSSHDPADYQQALAVANKPKEEKFPIGIIYQIDKPSYHEQIPTLDQPLINQPRQENLVNLLTQFQ